MPQGSPNKRSIIGLNAINFFQAEMVGVVLPVIGVFIKEHGWRYDSIGLATARILSYTFVRSPKAIVALQGLDGLGAGIYGVVVISLAADLTRGKGRFNTLAGLFATALAVGGVAGSVLSGILQHLGFNATFYTFAALAGIGAIAFTVLVPETKSGELSESALTKRKILMSP